MHMHSYDHAYFFSAVTSTVEKGSAEITGMFLILAFYIYICISYCLENTQATSPPLQPARSISFADESFGTVGIVFVIIVHIIMFHF